ncbi:uncharacterized protein LAESUDRAFT_713835 [Laetiporus sulphureus 93-53]|uniref:Uncharacterized protein n=1 Tax=Laetiporus sulphureus 93-53 TaxID=1314785 RepID=A0A165EGE7_9APHY|nr:uncharacterized protein LAESUDRAFT_713835 [Laetiporus sulphureus 93-53]KZT07003.1 hypothetical protein LAESUDRAFT_713835 [Laetiporus sulphureus 93-53]
MISRAICPVACMGRLTISRDMHFHLHCLPFVWVLDDTQPLDRLLMPEKITTFERREDAPVLFKNQELNTEAQDPLVQESRTEYQGSRPSRKNQRHILRTERWTRGPGLEGTGWQRTCMDGKGIERVDKELCGAVRQDSTVGILENWLTAGKETMPFDSEAMPMKAYRPGWRLKTMDG